MRNFITKVQAVLFYGKICGAKLYKILHPKKESSAAEDVVTEEYFLLQMNLFFAVDILSKSKIFIWSK
jgi:hypothetical protein